MASVHVVAQSQTRLRDRQCWVFLAAERSLVGYSPCGHRVRHD